MACAVLRAALCLTLLAPAQEPPSVEQLVAQLGSASWAEREAATAGLLEMGPEAIPALEKALQSPDSEVRHRARLLLDRVRWKAPPGLPDPLKGAMDHYASLPEQQRVALVARVVTELGHAAVRILQQVIRHDPSAEVRRQALDRLMRMDAAAAEVELRALANVKGHAAWAWQQLGDLLYRRGQTDDAIAAYERARQAGSADTRMAVSLARLYKARQDWGKARDLYLALVAAEPQQPDHQRELGECYHMLGDQAKAEETWRGMLKAQREGPQAYLWLAQAYRGIGARDKELAALREGCQKHPTDFELLRQFGRALAQEQHYGEAVEALERAVQAAGADYQRHAVNIELARILQASGRLHQHLQRREAGLAALDQQIIELLRRLAERRRAAGDRAGERQALERLIALYPGRPEARQAAQRVKQLQP